MRQTTDRVAPMFRAAAHECLVRHRSPERALAPSLAKSAAGRVLTTQPPGTGSSQHLCAARAHPSRKYGRRKRGGTERTTHRGAGTHDSNPRNCPAVAAKGAFHSSRLLWVRTDANTARAAQVDQVCATQHTLENNMERLFNVAKQQVDELDTKLRSLRAPATPGAGPSDTTSQIINPDVLEL